MAKLTQTLSNWLSFSARKEAPEATPAELATDLAEPEAPAYATADIAHTGKTRKALEEAPAEISLSTVVRAMRCARDLSDVPFFVTTAMELLRRSPGLRSVLQTRVLAVTSLPLVAEPGGKSLRERKAAEAAQMLLTSEHIEGVLPHLLLTNVYLGFGVAQLFVDTSNPLEYKLSSAVPVLPHYVVFDRGDGVTPYLLPKNAGEGLQPLQRGKFVYHSSNLIAGNPLTSSIAYAALFFEVLKTLTLHGWNGFREIYGQPIRKGTYPQGMGNTTEGRKDLEVLRKALQNLGSDAWAMLPKNMEIEFIDAASKGASADVYERLHRFLDEQLARMVLGGSLTSGTGNTGSGGSQALGTVHNEVRRDIRDADAAALSVTLRGQLVRTFTQWNFGAAVALPVVYFNTQDPVDVGAKVESITKLIDRGLRVPAAELYALLDVRAPDDTEEVLGGAVEPATDEPDNQEYRAKFSSERDALDDLSAELLSDDTYLNADAAASEALLAAIDGATDFESLKAALKGLVETADIDDLRATFAAAGTAARGAGESGVLVDGDE